VLKVTDIIEGKETIESFVDKFLIAEQQLKIRDCFELLDWAYINNPPLKGISDKVTRISIRMFKTYLRHKFGFSSYVTETEKEILLKLVRRIEGVA